MFGILGFVLHRKDPTDVEQVDAVGDVLFGGGLPEERRRFLQRLVGQVEGAPVETIKWLNKFSSRFSDRCAREAAWAGRWLSIEVF